MNLWFQSRTELENLPCIHANSDGTIDFSVTDEEQREVDAFFKLIEDYKFHPDIAPIIPKAGTAFALCRFAFRLVGNLPRPETETEDWAARNEIQDGLLRALAAVYKALSIYPTPVFTKHLIILNHMAGRKSEAARLRELKRDQDAEWKPSQLDNLFISWLEGSDSNVRQPMSNPDDLNDKILRTMGLFTEAAFFMLPPDDYEHDETLRRTVLVFLFGALDAVTQQFFFESHEKLVVLDAYLQQAFPSMSEEERESFIIFLADSSDDPTWIPVMQRGGQTLVDWGRGNTTAPLMLSHIIHFGIDDADTMRTPKSDDRNA